MLSKMYMHMRADTNETGVSNQGSHLLKLLSLYAMLHKLAFMLYTAFAHHTSNEGEPLMGRRASEAGSFYKRQDGTWVVALSLPSSNDSKRRRKYFYGRTKLEAQSKCDRFLKNGGQSKDESVKAYLNDWLANIKGTVAERTLADYTQVVQTYIIPELGHISLHRLERANVIALLQYVYTTRNRHRTAEKIRVVLRIALNEALRDGIILRNVARDVKPMRVESREPTTLQPLQVQKLLRAVKGDRLEALYHVAVQMGLRKGELLGLKWSQVNLEAGTLRVAKATSKSKRTRTLGIPASVLASLQRHCSLQASERAVRGEDWEDNNLVFPSDRGTPLDPSNLSRQFNVALQKAGLPKMRFHDLRHTCASLLAAQGASPALVRDILGHSQVNITMDIYTHISSDALSSELQKLDDTLVPTDMDNTDASLQHPNSDDPDENEGLAGVAVPTV